MGCDGGTIPRRDELVKVKKRPEAKDKDSELAFQWRCCAITQLALQAPIVMCGLGKLYNKVSVIEALVNGDPLPDGSKHIKHLKDIKDLKLTPNPIFKDMDKKEGSVDTRAAPFICPVIGLEMSGKFRFVALWRCGCVFSERALKEIATKNCHKCQKPFDEDDVVILNGNEQDLEVMKKKMEKRQVEHKKKRQNKVKVKEEPEASVSKGEATVSNLEVTVTKPEITVSKPEITVSKPEITVSKPEITVSKPEITVSKPEITVSKPEATSKFEAAGSSKTAFSKLQGPKVPAGSQKRLGSLVKAKGEKEAKKMKPDYSVAKDPRATDVYKSLFTTHKSEQEQNRAHWVTYNPFYN